MKKRMCMLLMAAMVLLTACGSIKNADNSTIYIDKDGKVTSVIVETFSEEYYSKQELETSMKSAVDTYNSSSDQTAVLLKSLAVKKQQVKAILEYESCAVYESFNNVPLFRGTAAQAQKAGYDFNTGFLSRNGDEASADAVLKENPNAYVIVLKEPIRVLTDQDIAYVSENVRMIENTLAQVLSDDTQDNDNTQMLTADYAYIIYNIGNDK